ncbi:hypothetical protein HC028_00100 [Planosporangium flavigriseum]|uniref:Uncharacterized protein n=1 Tax=Planosporangium flavigriseum TaxID=373681 RepID=A0A8J3LSL1_9ACTN|nr:hypothetical protein [Planosporangium flavigriseum]NJC62927.1 hypothetical protein [Planosporangium flavigriseum]GIG73209.1 hypothetical protein Pfl04_16130 [Planosporangium flavigriseum]
MTAVPELSTPARPARRAGRWLAAGAVASAAGLAATGVAIAAADHVDDLCRRQCEHLFHPITAAMPAYALPLSVVGAVLVVVAAVLA